MQSEKWYNTSSACRGYVDGRYMEFENDTEYINYVRERNEDADAYERPMHGGVQKNERGRYTSGYGRVD